MDFRAINLYTVLFYGEDDGLGILLHFPCIMSNNFYEYFLSYLKIDNKILDFEQNLIAQVIKKRGAKDTRGQSNS